MILDLGSPKQLSGIRFVIRSSANMGHIDFAVEGSNSISLYGGGYANFPPNALAYYSVADQFDLNPYYMPISGAYRYVKLAGNNHASWLAFAEVEVYGQ